MRGEEVEIVYIMMLMVERRKLRETDRDIDRIEGPLYSEQEAFETVD